MSLLGSNHLRPANSLAKTTLIVLAFLGVGGLTASLSYCSYHMSYISENIERAISARPQMQALEHHWRSGGLDVEVITPALAGETPAEHVARHAALVRANLLEWPADPTPVGE